MLLFMSLCAGMGVYGTAFWHMYSDATAGGDPWAVSDQYAVFPSDRALMAKVRRHSAALRNMSRPVGGGAASSRGGWATGEFACSGGGSA